MDETVRFYAGADLPLLAEFFSDAAETIPYPMTGAVVTLFASTIGAVPTITNPSLGAYQLNWSAVQTAAFIKKKPLQFQVKAVLPGGQTIISPPVTVIAL